MVRFSKQNEEGGVSNDYQLTILEKKPPLEVPLENTFSYETTQESPNVEFQSPEPETTSVGNDHGKVSLPVPPHKADEKKELVYADLAKVPGHRIKAPPVVEKGKYNVVTGFKNPEVSVIR